MNNIRRKILAGVSGYGVSLLLPSTGITASNAKKNSNPCNIHPETLNIIQKFYGKTSVLKTNHIKFYPGRDGMTDGGIFIAENPSTIPFGINFDPAVVHQPITFIMQRYHRNYHYISEYVAQYKTNGKVLSIAFRASVPEGFGKTEINMFAVAKAGASVVYACQRVNVLVGDEGCC